MDQIVSWMTGRANTSTSGADSERGAPSSDTKRGLHATELPKLATAASRKSNEKKVKRRVRRGDLPLSGAEPVFEHIDDPEVLVASSSYSYALGDMRAGRAPPQLGDGGSFSLRRRCNSMEQACRMFQQAMAADNPLRVYPVAAEQPCKKGYYKVMLFTGASKLQLPGRTSRGGPSTSSSATKSSNEGEVEQKQQEGQPSQPRQRRKADLEVVDHIFYKQHADINYRVSQDVTVKDLAKWMDMEPAEICSHNEGLKPNSRLVAGTVLNIPAVNCWSVQLDTGFNPVISDTNGKLIRDPRKATRGFEVLPTADGLVQVEYGVNFEHYCGAYCVQRDGVRAGRKD